MRGPNFHFALGLAKNVAGPLTTSRMLRTDRVPPPHCTNEETKARERKCLG